MVSISNALLLLAELDREDRVKLGRLSEGDALERKLASGRYIRVGMAKLRAPVYRSSRPGGKPGARSVGQSLHFQVNSVSKRAPAGQDGLTPREAAARADRVYLHPGRGQVATVKAAGGRYDRKNLCQNRCFT